MHGAQSSVLSLGDKESSGNSLDLKFLLWSGSAAVAVTGVKVDAVDKALAC